MGEPERDAGLEVVEQETDWGGHPLFPRPDTETGPDRRRFDIIHLTRYKSDGTKDICPRAWKGSELRSWQQISDAYGGGVYQLSAQCSRTYRFQAYSEKVQLPGREKPFVDEERAPVRQEPPQPPPPANPAPAIAAPAIAAPALMPPQAPFSGPAQYPLAPFAPPAPNNAAETAAIFKAAFEAASANQSVVLQAMAQNSAAKEGASPLAVVRELVPLFQMSQGNNQNNGDKSGILTGIEIARGFMGQNQQTQPQPVQAEDELALVGQVLRLIAPSAAPAAPAPAPAPAQASPPAATLAPPPAAPPPGWAWAFTAAGWVLVQMAQIQPYTTPATPSPAPAAPVAAPSAPAPQDVEAALAALLADPERLERVRAAIKAPTQPTQTPEPARVVSSAEPQAPSPSPVDTIGSVLEATLGSVDLGKLLSGMGPGGTA